MVVPFHSKVSPLPKKRQCSTTAQIVWTVVFLCSEKSVEIGIGVCLGNALLEHFQKRLAVIT